MIIFYFLCLKLGGCGKKENLLKISVWLVLEERVNFAHIKLFYFVDIRDIWGMRENGC